MAEAKPNPDWENSVVVDPRPTWRPVSEQAEMAAPHRKIGELPPLGYPMSEGAIIHWFEQTYHRMPAAAAVGVIQEKMAQRVAEQPAADPPNEQVFEER